MRGLIAALILLASPAAAQDRMSPETCVASWNSLLDLVPVAITADRVVADLDGWCDAVGVVITADGMVSGYAGHVRWRGIDLERFTDGGLPPRSLEVQLDAIAALPQIGDPVFDYIYTTQAKTSDMAASLAMRWDGVQNALIVDEARFAFGAIEAINLSGRIEGVDLTDAATMQTSLGTAGLRDLSVKMTFDAWFETMMLFVIGNAVLDGTSDVPMDAQVDAAKGAGVAFMQALPDDILTQRSRDAASAFIDMMPHPRGVMDLQFAADPTFGAARAMTLMGLGPDATAEQIIGRLLGDTDLRLSWTPTTGGTP